MLHDDVARGTISLSTQKKKIYSTASLFYTKPTLFYHRHSFQFCQAWPFHIRFQNMIPNKRRQVSSTMLVSTAVISAAASVYAAPPPYPPPTEEDNNDLDDKGKDIINDLADEWSSDNGSKNSSENDDDALPLDDQQDVGADTQQSINDVDNEDSGLLSDNDSEEQDSSLTDDNETLQEPSTPDIDNNNIADLDPETQALEEAAAAADAGATIPNDNDASNIDESDDNGMDNVDDSVDQTIEEDQVESVDDGIDGTVDEDQVESVDDSVDDNQELADEDQAEPIDETSNDDQATEEDVQVDESESYDIPELDNSSDGDLDTAIETNGDFDPSEETFNEAALEEAEENEQLSTGMEESPESQLDSSWMEDQIDQELAKSTEEEVAEPPVIDKSNSVPDIFGDDETLTVPATTTTSSDVDYTYTSENLDDTQQDESNNDVKNEYPIDDINKEIDDALDQAQKAGALPTPQAAIDNEDMPPAFNNAQGSENVFPSADQQAIGDNTDTESSSSALNMLLILCVLIFLVLKAPKIKVCSSRIVYIYYGV